MTTFGGPDRDILEGAASVSKSAVLIVGANNWQQYLLRESLGSQGFIVFNAETPTAAWHFLSQFTPDAILTDFSGHECLEFVGVVGAKAETAGIPVMAILAPDSKVRVKDAKAVGAVRAMRRPLNMDRLVTILREMVAPRTAKQVQASFAVPAMA